MHATKGFGQSCNISGHTPRRYCNIIVMCPTMCLHNGMYGAAKGRGSSHDDCNTSGVRAYIQYEGELYPHIEQIYGNVTIDCNVYVTLYIQM